MHLKNLHTFIQVTELGSFTKAAQRLGFSQSTVTFQIKQLETELGVQLFERIRHTVTLTEQGQMAVSPAPGGHGILRPDLTCTNGIRKSIFTTLSNKSTGLHKRPVDFIFVLKVFFAETLMRPPLSIRFLTAK